ncbi:MAG: hypothetical protein E6K14_06305 [Methanobacteriota archaeon]|nr:MAG: hypothetical protein E6K14_06305 [Euryarchaeota archaeon]
MDDLLGVRVPPPREGFVIRETTIDSALRKKPLPGLDYSFNPYIGCYHGCVFCVVPRLMRMDRAAWGASVIVKRNAAPVLAREVRKLPRGLVAISTATDPYQFVEGKYRGMSVPTLDDRARALLEPWAPPIEARLRCLRTLADAGLATFVSFSPGYPPTGGWTASTVADTFQELGIRKGFSRLLDPRWGARDAMIGRLAGSDLEAELTRFTDRETMVPFIGAVARECRDRGIVFRTDPEDASRRTTSE